MEIDKYHSIEWGVNCIFQTDKLAVAQAMKTVKEDAEIKARELKLEELENKELIALEKETVYRIFDLLDS